MSRYPQPAKIQENVPLAPLTTLGVGGAARYFAAATSEHEIHEALDFAAHQLPIFILGGGSNLVVADAGFPGLVLRVALHGVQTFAAGDQVLVTAAAGEDWDSLVAHCVMQGWAGIECLSGIPGSVGGTPVQNVGAYGQEVSETIVTMRALDRQRGQIVELSNAECAFGYRRSRFNSTERERFIVLQVTYRLRVNGVPALQYADVQRFFLHSTDPPTLAKVREAILTIRRRKAMVIDPADPDTRSAGSFFKNPVVPEAAFAELATAMQAAGLLKAEQFIPHYLLANGQVKLLAAWLIERAGFTKGYTRGRVGLSSKHTLALVNRNKATAAEVIALMREIQDCVQAQFGVPLVPEPVFVGFTEEELERFSTR
jgi:UDP-N-acetylmuramate dehydrogenase